MEVMLAVAILSLATVLTMSVVNHEHANALAAINRASVRSAIGSQVEMLWYFHDVGVNSGSGYENKVWREVSGLAVEGGSNQSDICSYGENAFFFAEMESPVIEAPLGHGLVVNGGSYSDENVVLTFDADGERLPYASHWDAKPGRGIWINAVKGGAVGLEYIDFYVKACWRGVVGGRVETSSTLVRINLYE